MTRAADGGPGRVVVHIGLGKTGTSTIQTALYESRAALAQAGVFVPGERHVHTRIAVYDLIGRRIGGLAPEEGTRVPGAWERRLGEIRASGAPTVVLSEELLAVARPADIRRLVSSLAPRRVEVVVTLRDLGRVVGSYWQQMVVMGRSEPLAEFVQTVRDPRHGPASAAVAFWLRQDVVRILDAWETQVDRSAITVVTVPPAGSDPNLLNDRFAETIGAPAGLLRSRTGTDNSSLGRLDTEVVRRLNLRLGADYPENRRLSLMRALRKGLADHPKDPIVLPPEHVGWVTERAAQDVAALRGRGYHVVGSLDDLVPGDPGVAAPPPSDGQLAEATLDALAVVAREQGRLFHKRSKRLARRRARLARQAGVPAESSPTRLASRARATSFRLRTWALARSDDSRLLGWAARTYLRRRSRR